MLEDDSREGEEEYSEFQEFLADITPNLEEFLEKDS